MCLGNPERTTTTPEDSVNLPGLENYLYKDLPTSLNPDNWPVNLECHLRNMHKAAGFLLNAFEEMHVEEGRGLQRLLQELATDREAARVYFIGPQLQIPTFTGVKRKQELATQLTSKTADAKSRCLQFLDSQPAASVLYISFGTRSDMSKVSIPELARGLEDSEIRFLWILRPPMGAPSTWHASQVLPEGFETKIKGRGLVWSEWVSQKEILSHPSIGGFLSHCGWNSTLEAVCCGIPIICWPLEGDQRMNARLLVNLQVGLEMKTSTNNAIVGSEVAKAIQRLLVSDEGPQMRERMQELKIVGKSSTLDGGSSYRYFQEFLQDVTSFRPVQKSI